MVRECNYVKRIESAVHKDLERVSLNLHQNERIKVAYKVDCNLGKCLVKN